MRFEYEKRRGASNLYKKVMETGSIRPIINSIVSFPFWDTWREIMGTDIDPVMRGKALSGDNRARMDWVLRSAIPAMAKEIVESY